MMAEARLTGQVAVVTGGGRGIGRGISERLARDGAHVVINYCERREAAEDTAQAIRTAGGSASVAQADVANGNAVRSMIDGVAQERGRLDILVNNAGRGGAAGLTELDEERWDNVVDTNLKGVYLCSRAATPIMVAQRRGNIVSILSNCAYQGFAGLTHYCASKGGGLLFTQALAIELGPYGVRVNAVGPGTIETELTEKGLSFPEWREGEIRETPLGRLGSPEDVAGAVSFLASDDASWITGQTLYVDGGYGINGGSHYAARITEPVAAT